jgi:hypothetical protein
MGPPGRAGLNPHELDELTSTLLDEIGRFEQQVATRAWCHNGPGREGGSRCVGSSFRILARSRGGTNRHGLGQRILAFKSFSVVRPDVLVVD